jgi:hypothetical protein
MDEYESTLEITEKLLDNYDKALILILLKSIRENHIAVMKELKKVAAKQRRKKYGK